MDLSRFFDESSVSLKKAFRKRLKKARSSEKANDIKTSAGLVFSLKNSIESYINLHKSLGFMYIRHRNFLERMYRRIAKIIREKYSEYQFIRQVLTNTECRAGTAQFQEIFRNYTLCNPVISDGHDIGLSTAVSQYERDPEKAAELRPMLDSWFRDAEKTADECIRNTAQTVIRIYANNFPKYRDPSLDVNFSEWILNETEKQYKNALNRLKKKEISFPGLLHTKTEEPQWKADEIFLQIRKIFKTYFSGLDPQIFSVFNGDRVSLRLQKFKSSGAFTDPVTPETGPYLFMNFRGQIQDVITLAHESGHMFYYMLRRNKNFFNYANSDIHSETAAAFAEFLAAENLETEKKTKDELLRSIIHYKIIRQNIIFNAEYDYYKTLAADPDNSPPFADSWARSWNTFIKNSGTEHSHWFAYNRHYIFCPLYGITYIAGTLAGLGFYQMIENGKIKKEEFIEFLKKDFVSCSEDEVFMKAVTAGFKVIESAI